MQVFCFVLVCFIKVNVNAIGGTSWPLANLADGSKKDKTHPGMAL